MKNKSKQNFERFLEQTNPLEKKSKDAHNVVWKCGDCDEINWEKNMIMVRICPSCESREVYVHGRLNEVGRFQIIENKS